MRISIKPKWPMLCKKIAVSKIYSFKNLAIQSSLKGRVKLGGPTNMPKSKIPASLNLYSRPYS